MIQQKSILLLAATMAVALANQQMPRFQFDQKTKASKIMLTWDDQWEVGGSNMLAILSNGKQIRIRVSVTGDTGSGMKRLLIYKCTRASPEETIDLGSLSSASDVSGRCIDKITFTITTDPRGGRDDFLLIMGTSKLSYTDVFTERVELSVKVEYGTGSMTSNKLFVWSLDAISTFSGPSASTGYTRRFLTDEAFTFMKRIDSGSTGDFRSVSFLDPEISRVLKAAPDFFKVKMNLGAILYFDAGSCLNFQMGKAIMFVNYNSKLDSENQKFQKLMKLNIDDGKLTYSYCGLKSEVRRFYDEKKPSSSVGVCSIVSFSGEVEPYQKTDSVLQRVPLSDVSYTTCATSSKACQVISATSPAVTILSGMDYTALVCPIICADKTEVFRFFRYDRPLIGSPTDDWALVDPGVRISRTGNIIEFPSTLSSSHSGVYRCEAGSVSFSYTVKVISLPQFVTNTYTSGSMVVTSGLLPQKIFAIEGESLSYHCEVYFASLDTVKVEPVFYFVSSTGGKVSWDKLSIEAFRLKVGADAVSFSLNETFVDKDSRRLTVSVARVPPVHPSYGTNFTHRFVCDASIAGVESMKEVGMPAYAVQSGGDVVFVPRLTRSHFVLNPNNNCSLQKCAFGRGAFFEFSLTDEFMAYLNDIGVEVVSYLRIDGDLLSDVKILFNSNATEILTDSVPQRLAYRIYPISEKDVAAELVKRRWLTPVFNFRYAADSDLQNLKLDKETTHGSPNVALGNMDCRADRFCFYSTDFDTGASLDFLPEALTFSMPTDPLPIAAANAMIIGIVIAVICLIIFIVLVVYFVRRDPERAYLVEEKEIQLGHNPKEEAKAETFKEYQRVANPPGEDADAPLQGNRMSIGSSLSVASGDDKELDQYKEDIDFKDFGEQGSFIGGYQNDPRKKEAFNEAQGNEETV